MLLAGVCVVGCLAALCSCQKPRLEGTSWKLHYEVLAMDDGPSIRCTQILKFVDATKVELHEVNDRRGYSASYVNDDGTVSYTPGSVDKSTKTGSYVVKEDVVEITFDEKTEPYYIRGKKLICNTDDEEYSKMSDFDRDFVTYHLFKEKE